MFRTELLELSENKKTTETLKFYEQNLFTWCRNNNCTITKEDDAYKILNSSGQKEEIKNGSFDLKSFLAHISKPENSEETETALLPYIAWLKTCIKNDKNISFKEYSKLALNFILRYNYKI